MLPPREELQEASLSSGIISILYLPNQSSSRKNIDGMIAVAYIAIAIGSPCMVTSWDRRTSYHNEQLHSIPIGVDQDIGERWS